MSDTEVDNVVEFGWDAPEEAQGGKRKTDHKNQKKKAKPGTFENMQLSENVLKAIRKKGYKLPTPIQRKTMPMILQGLDVVGMARTGSGKTAAFVIPMFERLKEHSPKAGARAVIMSPTRELALQTHKVVRDLGRFTGLRTAVLVGGDAMEAQFAELAQNPDVLVVTPGRLLHHLSEVEGLSLRSTEYCVVDEADRMFEMGFAEQVRELLQGMSERRQTLLFSATMPATLADFAQAGLRNAQLVRLDVERRLSPDLKLAFFMVRQDDKLGALLHVVRELVDAKQLTILFAATRHHVDFLHAFMTREGIDCAAVYGTMDQTARKISVARFRAQKVHLLIVTDVAARGIDIPLIDNVINFDFPPKPELFVHRTGRAARMGRSGTAFSLLTRDELPFMLDLHLYLSRGVKPAPEVPDLEHLEEQMNSEVSIYGTMPAASLEPLVEHARQVIDGSSELQGQLRSVNNAFRMYCKTRPASAVESVRRAKGMPPPGQHPMLLSRGAAASRSSLEDEKARLEFAQRLKSFRPAATVLEAEIANVRPAMGAGSTVPTDLGSKSRSKSNEVMARKRKWHATIIEKERAKKEARPSAGAAEGPSKHHAGGAGSDGDEGMEDGDGAAWQEGDSSGDEGGARQDARAEAAKTALLGDGVLNEGRYRDKSFYLGHSREESTVPESERLRLEAAGSQLAAAVLELNAEDADGMSAQQRRYHWDKKKKRYVKLSSNETIKAGKRIRTESGKVVEGKTVQHGLYDKWVKHSKMRVAATGAGEDPQAAKALANRFTKGGRHTSWKAQSPGASPGGRSLAARGELKNKDQVRKERKVVERRKEHLQERMAAKGGVKKRRGDGDSKRGGGRQGGSGRGGKAFGGGSGGGGQRQGGERGGKGFGKGRGGGQKRGGSGGRRN